MKVGSGLNWLRIVSNDAFCISGVKSLGSAIRDFVSQSVSQFLI